MSHLIPQSPGPDSDDDARGEQRRADGQRRRPRPGPTPSVEELEAAILRVTELTLLGRISSKLATVAVRGFKTVLDSKLKREQAGGTAELAGSLVDQCRENPDLVDAIAPLLGDDMFSRLLAEMSREPEEEDEDRDHA